jgi:malate synthase
VLREDVSIAEKDLIAVPVGAITERGLRANLEIAVRYLEAWLSGNGCVPIHHLMEDAATAEISRAQVWQWQRHGARLEDGRAVDAALVKAILDRLDLAAKLVLDLSTASEMSDFLTLPAYPHVQTLLGTSPPDEP